MGEDVVGLEDDPVVAGVEHADRREVGERELAVLAAPVMSAAMLCAATLAIVSLICPVLGTPAGTAVGSGGAIAVATPAA